MFELRDTYYDTYYDSPDPITIGVGCGAAAGVETFAGFRIRFGAGRGDGRFSRSVGIFFRASRIPWTRLAWRWTRCFAIHAADR